MDTNDKIYIAGHNGMAESAIVRALKRNGFSNIITANRSELDLSIQQSVVKFFNDNKIDVVYNGAANVGAVEKEIALNA